MNIQEFLARKNIQFELLEHGDTYDAQHMAQAIHVSGHHVAKTVLLRANVDGQYVIAVLPATHAVDFDKAAEKYRQGVAVEPDSPLCRYYLIDLLMEHGDEATAQKYADEIRALDKSVNARGIAHGFSADPALRQKFQDHLARFDLI